MSPLYLIMRGTCPQFPRFAGWRRANHMQSPQAKNLRLCADEARALADMMQQSRTRLAMWKLACSYDLLARHAEAREDREPGGLSYVTGEARPGSSPPPSTGGGRARGP